jgi:DNA-binding MarR family transcriptional regulator
MDRTEIIAKLMDTLDLAKRSMHAHMQTVVEGHAISRTQLELLFTIHVSQPTTAKDLAQKLQLTAGAISQLVEELVEQGLIERETDASDRRRQVLRASANGDKLIKAFDKRRRDIMNRVIQDLSDEELLTWLKIQKQIINEFQSTHQVHITKEK